MNIKISSSNPSTQSIDLLIVPVFEGRVSQFKEFSALDRDIQDAAKRENFSGKNGQTLVLYTQGKIEPYKVLFIGLGKKEELTQYQFRVSIAKASRAAKSIKAVSIGVYLHNDMSSLFTSQILAQAVTESIILSTYKFMTYKSDESKKSEREIESVFIFSSASKIQPLEEGTALGEIFAKATIEARDLINEPSSHTTPTFLAEKALSIAKESKGTVKVTVYGYQEIKKMKMESFLGVSQGSDEEPKFIELHYKPKGASKKIILAGKGITFDTGGLSLKPAEHMETMKMDMSGAASVLGVFSALYYLKPNVEIIGLIAACENMPSGKAIKPGDILKARNGTTIEVLNTDAEGRLTLADVLSYAVEMKPDAVIDLATLTGACMVALGQEIAGMWGNNKTLVSKLEEASRVTGEKLWTMPLEEDYKDLIKSSVADLKNIQTGRYGGAITAALFLSEFVGNTPWVHLDIAGPAFEERDTPLVPRGGAGFGVRTLLSYLLHL